MTTLRATINELASTFAAGVLSAIRGASLEEILAETNRGGASSGSTAVVRRGPGRPRGSVNASAASAAAEPAGDEGSGGRRGGRRGRRGRLGRRSSTDIAAIVDSIVSLLGSNPDGLRAEEIRQQLGLEANELPRPIKEALDSKRISKQGQKRATTYFARGGGGGQRAGAAKKSARGGAAKKSARGGRRAKRASGVKKMARGGRKAGSSSASQSNGATNEATA